MTKMNLDNVAKLYTNSLKEHGDVPKGVGWTDDQSHDLRFKKLASVIQTKDLDCTINDLGCGYGAFFEYLKNKKYSIKFFNGYEISDEMFKMAEKRLSQSIPHQVVLSKDPKLSTLSDYSFASGIFNVKFEKTKEEWLSYILETLNNMNEFSKKGFAFNLLTSYVDWEEDHLYYGDPCFFFDYCKKNFSKKVTLFHDTDMYEWTICVTQ